MCSTVIWHSVHHVRVNIGGEPVLFSSAVHHHGYQYIHLHLKKRVGLHFSFGSLFSSWLCKNDYSVLYPLVVTVFFSLGGVTRRQRRPGRGGRTTPWRRGWGRGWRDRSRWDTSSTRTALDEGGRQREGDMFELGCNEQCDTSGGQVGDTALLKDTSTVWDSLFFYLTIFSFRTDIFICPLAFQMKKKKKNTLNGQMCTDRDVTFRSPLKHFIHLMTWWQKSIITVFFAWIPQHCNNVVMMTVDIITKYEHSEISDQ